MPTLHWLKDDETHRTTYEVPYRLQEDDPALLYGDQRTENMLIQGNNLAANISLLPHYGEQLMCIYIDR